MIRIGLSVFIAASVLTTEFAYGDDPLPTLDELLGLVEKGTDPDAEQPVKINKELDQALSEHQAGEAFAQAVSMMDQAANQIGEETGLSLDTQRLQQSIIDKLDAVIESANENQNSSGGQSSSPPGAQQQQPDQPQSQQQSDESSNSGDDPSTPPGLSEGQLADAPAMGAAGWGNLPDRVRKALTQGLNDTYSELYRKLTEEYYRALAEETE